MKNVIFDKLFKTIDNSNSIAELFELDAIPPINYATDFFFISYFASIRMQMNFKSFTIKFHII